LAYQPPANSIFLSQQTSYQQPVSSIFLSQQTSHQQPATSNQPTILFSQNKSAPTNTSQTNNPDERKGRAEETEETRDSSSP
jgi:hypothetical protein